MLNSYIELSINVEFIQRIIDKCGIQIELNSKVKYEIFGPVVHTPNSVMPGLNTCGYLYYEVQSTTYVIRFLAEIQYNYKEIYAPVIDTISFRILINLVDWICAYLYELLNIPEGFIMPEA